MFSRQPIRFITLLAVAVLAALPGSLAASPACEEPELKAEAFQPIDAPGVRLGLALGSGSVHGLAHIGVIRELEERGLEVRVVAGTSVGALVGALWASGMKAREIEELGRSGDWDNIGPFAFSWQGLLSNKPLKGQLEGVFAGRPVESWPRRFGAVATNVDNGQRVILDRGDGATAVQASSSVPVLFPPVAMGTLRLADGALVEPVPVDSARVLGADYVIGVDVAYRPYEEAASGMTGFAFQAMHILINSLAAVQMRAADFPIHLDLHHRLMACGPQSLVVEGRRAVRRAWPELARSIAQHAARRKTP